MTADPATCTVVIRRANARLRDLDRRGGRTGATTKARGGHVARKEGAERALLADGHRELVGALVDEDKLLRRLANGGGPRPELRARLRAVKYDIAELVFPIHHRERTTT